MLMDYKIFYPQMLLCNWLDDIYLLSLDYAEMMLWWSHAVYEVTSPFSLVYVNGSLS